MSNNMHDYGTRLIHHNGSYDNARTLHVVDSHTCGQTTRVIMDSGENLVGLSPTVARDHFRTQADWVRRMAVLEPRGHRSMFAAALIAPSAAGEPFGIVFMDANGYPDMCGHATIGVVTTLCELALIPSIDLGTDGHFQLPLLTPVGTLAIEVEIKDGRCQAVSFQIPQAYYIGSVEVDTGHGKKTTVEIAYGGQYYGFVESDSVGLSVQPDLIDELIEKAKFIRQELGRTSTLSDPLTGVVPSVGNIVWIDEPRAEGADGLNVPVSGAHSFDRSPCGTATCARMAVRVAKGLLKVGDDFVNESIMGTHYRGRIVKEERKDGSTYLVPRVTGSAWITALSQLVVSKYDPLGNGFLIGGGKAVV
ncbi:proline racemase family protein [Komagataeibacter saccharivorans]|uniref:proline racemase family protein n=1 Tax=Komagataeibacter saccharivorans TaxID=265959 RepID=UPI000C8216FD|nr:proline racemase family protein [Komagataeibacter saccharivorans]MBL7238166.1 proline racemase family protein [Novacetimonas hansenii]PMP98929.1 4-hydroxyproline epimerase [Komagataeibacter saccharivorans]